VLKAWIKSAVSRRTRQGLRLDLKRLVARSRGALSRPPDRLPLLVHLGCGSRKVPGFLNVDIQGSDHDLDLAAGRLPWHDGSIEAVVSQQVIEHLEIESQLRPLLRELARVLKPGGEAWLACPDMEAIARSYLADGGQALLDDHLSRWPKHSLGGLPVSHMVNVIFHQFGEHVNLFDLTLLRHLLLEAGFSQVDRVRESDLLSRFPGFPPRHDDAFCLYVRAVRPRAS
jgi:predicted SAM-dependent methyltransferase